MKQMIIKKTNMNLETRKCDEHDKAYIEGYASAFNVKDQDKDIITKGAFEKFLKNGKRNEFKLLWQHDALVPIGKVFHIEEDDYGLLIKAYITKKTEKAKEALMLVKEGILDSLSIGFIPKKVKHDRYGDSIIVEADLHEISLVTFPCNEMSKITYFDI